jgi:hypothetical protein
MHTQIPSAGDDAVNIFHALAPPLSAFVITTTTATTTTDANAANAANGATGACIVISVTSGSDAAAADNAAANADADAVDVVRIGVRDAHCPRRQNRRRHHHPQLRSRRRRLRRHRQLGPSKTVSTIIITALVTNRHHRRRRRFRVAPCPCFASFRLSNSPRCLGRHLCRNTLVFAPLKGSHFQLKRVEDSM